MHIWSQIEKAAVKSEHMETEAYWGALCEPFMNGVRTSADLLNNMMHCTDTNFHPEHQRLTVVSQVQLRAPPYKAQVNHTGNTLQTLKVITSLYKNIFNFIQRRHFTTCQCPTALVTLTLLHSETESSLFLSRLISALFCASDAQHVNCVS